MNIPEQYAPHIDIAVKAALEAGQEIMDVYEKSDAEMGVQQKSDDSPLTIADSRAHQKIMEHLKNTPFPVLSEEGKSIPYDERKAWSTFWMVDPLDGTKEFIKRNGEFTVNIALIINGHSAWGVVYAPVLDQLFSLDPQGNAYIINKGVKTMLPRAQKAFDASQSDLRVVASRSHLNQETEDFLNDLKNPQIVSMGSSLKFMILAQNKADVYPRFAPTMEWDTAAAHAVLKATGRNVFQLNDEELVYNKEDLLNPWFVGK